MPLNIDFMQILLHMLNFVILAGGLIFLLYLPIQKFLEQRKQYFSDLEEQNRAAAEENKKLQAEYEQKLLDVEQELSEKRKANEKDMAEVSARTVKEAEQKAQAILQAAEQEAEERKTHILESAQTEISELVLSSAQRLLSDTVTPQRDSALYDEFIRLARQEQEGKRNE